MEALLIEYAWVIWAALILIFVVVEVFTLDFTFLMLAVGSVGGIVLALADAPFWGQVLVTAAIAVLLLFAVRPALLRRLHHGQDPAKSNIEALLGIDATAVVDFVDSAGSAKLANGETWTARTSDATSPVKGDKLRVLRIDGATAVVSLATPPTEGLVHE